MSALIKKSKEGLTLFCACIEFWHGNKLVAEKLYVETVDLATARGFFARRKPKNGKIVAVAPVIGFHAQDDHGDLLKA